jgi:hypothetical protein
MWRPRLPPIALTPQLERRYARMYRLAAALHPIVVLSFEELNEFADLASVPELDLTFPARDDVDGLTRTYATVGGSLWTSSGSLAPAWMGAVEDAERRELAEHAVYVAVNWWNVLRNVVLASQGSWCGLLSSKESSSLRSSGCAVASTGRTTPEGSRLLTHDCAWRAGNIHKKPQ